MDLKEMKPVWVYAGQQEATAPGVGRTADGEVGWDPHL